MTRKTHPCPLCDGSGSVTAAIANARISIRDREKYNETMRDVNRRARLRAKKKALAT